ncbi:transient receptor potential cation channel subfamily A member 1 homolog [Nematostella vectensis]|nr:transient receptor potential cation channel subfamily A member 1 homolog [Nematostella vectensis]
MKVMSYNLRDPDGEVHTNPSANGKAAIEMTQVNPIHVDQPPILPKLPELPIPVVSETPEYSNITFHQAARDGRAELIEQRLNKLARHHSRKQLLLNRLDDDKTSPLHYAVRYGHLKVVKILVENGADINIPGEDGATPLHFAARFGVSSKLRRGMSREVMSSDINVAEVIQNALLKAAGSDEALDIPEPTVEESQNAAIIQYLLSKDANVNVQDTYGLTPLHYAANKCNLNSTVELLKCLAVKVDERDTSGGTALHSACTEGATEVAHALIKAGADIQAKDYEYMTPFHFACMEGHLETASLLLEAAEKIGGEGEVGLMLSNRNREKEAALHCAIDGGHKRAVKLCIDKGADVMAARSNNTQPLHLAAVSGNVEIGKMLVEKGANIEGREANQETPLHRAACFNRIKFVEYLLDIGANIECKDKDNFTPLLSASSSGHTASIQLLMDRGANLRAKDTHDRTAIYMAAEENCVEALKELLKHPFAKALVNEGDLYEDTPLHIAAMKGYLGVTEILLDHGARIDARNDEDYTPLHLAAKYGRARTAEALLRRDSDIVNDEDESSNTPLHLAAIEGNVKCVKTLLNHGAAVDARNANLWTPLDCAAAYGWVKCASALLDFDSPVDPTDRTRTTPLHLASRSGHVDMVELLLNRNANIILTDHTGRNCLDMAIDDGRKDVAMAIINSPNWEDVLKNKTLEQGTVTTPMRKLIDKLPDVAEAVLNKCVTDNGLPLYHPEYKIDMNYEYLEDLYADWMDLNSSSMKGSETGSVSSFNIDRKSEYGYQMIDEQNFEQVQKQLEWKSRHPLMIMVKRKREKLLSHPIVTSLLQHKWRTYGRYVYYLKLFIYCVFLVFLTGYSVYDAQAKTSVNMTTCDYPASYSTGTPYDLWVRLGSIIILILACWHILMELFQMVYQRSSYIDWENLLEWIVYTTAIAFVAPEFQGVKEYGFSKCREWFSTVGAISIWSAWMSLVLFIRKFPLFGIYVVMFTDILNTFLMFSTIFLLFIIAFALAFFTLFSAKPQFTTVGRSLMKTGVMMIGEFEFDSIFENEPAIAWVLFVIFLVVMTLILMNLLIGLAVDDIKGVQEQAVLKRQAMLVDLALDVEKAMPRRIRKNFAVTPRESFLPNSSRGFFWFLHSHLINPQEMREALDIGKSPMQVLEGQNEDLVKKMSDMRTRVRELQEQQENMQNILRAVAKKLDVEINYDVVEED